VEPQPKKTNARTQFAFLGRSAAGHRMTAEDELKQLPGSGHSNTLALRGHHLERQCRHLVCHSMLDWQPVERPEKWSTRDSCEFPTYTCFLTFTELVLLVLYPVFDIFRTVVLLNQC